MQVGFSLGAFAAVVLGAAAFFGVVAAGYVGRYSVPLPSAAGIYVCFLAYFILALIPGFPAVRRSIANLVGSKRRKLLLIGFFVGPYLAYAAGTGDFHWVALGKLVLLDVVPVSIYVLIPVRDPDRLTGQDLLAWLWLMMPVILRLESGIWTRPVNLDFMARLFTIGVASWCWVILRPVPGIGYGFTVSVLVLRASLVNFIEFAIVALPLGWLLGLATWHPRWRGLWNFCVDYVTIFIFVAWLEELFFRGVTQTLFQKISASPIRAQLGASAAFGMSHILLAPAPNWRYATLASVAGWFYGSAFRTGGSLMAPAMMHALVDTVWRTWFGR